jgi:hypothetical protein
MSAKLIERELSLMHTSCFDGLSEVMDPSGTRTRIMFQYNIIVAAGPRYCTVGRRDTSKIVSEHVSAWCLSIRRQCLGRIDSFPFQMLG